MKIIDEKGKIFGKINIIDLLVLLVLIAGLVLLAVRFTGSKDKASPAATSGHLTYQTMCAAINEDVYEEILRQMDAGGGKVQLMASGEMLNAYVTHVDAKPHVNLVYDDQANLHYVEEYGENRRMDITFTIDADGVDQLLKKVGTQEVRVGRTHIVKTLNFEFTNGVITSCSWS